MCQVAIRMCNNKKCSSVRVIRNNQVAIWNELHSGDTEITDDGRHEDDVPMEELVGLSEELPCAKRKTPGGSAIIVHSQFERKPVKLGTKWFRTEGEPCLLSSCTWGSGKAVVCYAGQRVEH